MVVSRGGGGLMLVREEGGASGRVVWVSVVLGVVVGEVLPGQNSSAAPSDALPSTRGSSGGVRCCAGGGGI